jgi:hypothetical protein
MKSLIVLISFAIIASGCARQEPASKLDTVNPNYTFTSPSSSSITPQVPLESLSDAIKRQLATKYNKSQNDAEVSVTEELSAYAKGLISFKGEQGGAIWFAALEKGGWILVTDGQGPVSCDKANEYEFPNSLIPECLQNGKVIKR